ncbi:MAG: hypothetical protein M3N48_08730 [Verrucomicrobiota bacterium]|nr:hypothetical protein [Verrucomicrobiota bacterium]
MQEPNYFQSVAALFSGFVAVVVLSLGCDQLLHVLKVYPPWGEPMPQPALNALALSYRIVFTIFGSYLTAKIAPRNPMQHAMILGLIGTVFGTLGAVATIPMHLGPAWYPIAIAATALPCAWIGGKMASQ